MNVTDAVNSRKSTRAFLSKSVSTSLLKKLLKKSSRSASGGNLQPWRIYVINKKSMQEFLNFQQEFSRKETPSYEIYPKNLKEPYRSSRFELGEEMYSLLNIPREDKEGRFAQLLKNFSFFGAPAAFFCYVDKQMGPPQWSDLGMFLQTFMLLAKEAGLDTCAQEAWSAKHDSVSEFLQTPKDEILFCGMAIGFSDPDSPINSLNSSRRPLSEWAKFI